MKFKTLLKFCFLQLILLTLAVFICFYKREQDDPDVIIFTTFIYLPYVIGLILLNSTLVYLGIIYLKQITWISATLITIVLASWYLLSSGQIQVYFWKISHIEFLALNFLLLVVNVVMVYLVTMKKVKRTD